ncbi:MAG TPA: Wzz/FepE/Etk N-terminal domain-containing protein [Thermoanaerobaculia bacterium]|nr:Wzz/FepE/Etk N-terminal domain-containing protein [Thermoanaerobaculia bacterium]
MNESRVVLRALARGWWIVLLALVVALAVAAWLTGRERPTYSAEALMVVVPSTEVEDTDDLLDSIEALERRTVVATFARLPRSPQILDDAARRMGVERRDLRSYWVGGSALPNTNLIRIEVLGPDGERAAVLANAVADATRREARRLYRVYSLRDVARAEPPRRPVRPDRGRNLAVAAVLGLFVGVVGAIAVEAMRRTSDSST